MPIIYCIRILDGIKFTALLEEEKENNGYINNYIFSNMDYSKIKHDFSEYFEKSQDLWQLVFSPLPFHDLIKLIIPEFSEFCHGNNWCYRSTPQHMVAEYLDKDYVNRIWSRISKINKENIVNFWNKEICIEYNHEDKLEQLIKDLDKTKHLISNAVNMQQGLFMFGYSVLFYSVRGEHEQGSANITITNSKFLGCL